MLQTRGHIYAAGNTELSLAKRMRERTRRHTGSSVCDILCHLAKRCSVYVRASVEEEKLYGEIAALLQTVALSCTHYFTSVLKNTERAVKV